MRARTVLPEAVIGRLGSDAGLYGAIALAKDAGLPAG
jgi:hypothetical protein